MSGLEMENTASAFVAAGQRSYFGIETDVHRTADGQFIIIHDDNTKRVAGDEMIVEQTSFRTLRSLRLLDTDGQQGRGDLILPSLREYISICKNMTRRPSWSSRITSSRRTSTKSSISSTGRIIWIRSSLSPSTFST